MIQLPEPEDKDMIHIHYTEGDTIEEDVLTFSDPISEANISVPFLSVVAVINRIMEIQIPDD